MAGEETENVGGISIGVSIDDSTAESELNAFLNRLTQIAQQRAIPVQLAIQQPTAAARQAQQSTQLTFGGRARGGASAREATGLERAIAEALAKEGQQTADATTTALDKGRQSANLTIEQALAQSIGGQAPTAIPVTADFSEFKEQFGAFLGELRGLVSEASKVATVEVTAAGAAGGGGGRRRKNIVAAAGGEDDEEQQRILIRPRTARSEAEAEAFAAQRARQLAGRRAFQESERARRQELTDTSRQYDNLAALATQFFDQRERRIPAASSDAEAETFAVQRARQLAGRRAFQEAERSRQRELTDTGRQYDQLAALATQYFDKQERRIPAASEHERALREASFEAQQEQAGFRPSATLVGRQRSPAEIAALRAQQQRDANARAGTPGRRFSEAEQAELEARRARGTTVSGRQSQQIEENAAFTSGQRVGAARARGVAAGRARGLDEEDLARREEQSVAASEAQRLTAARTARTFASGLGGFFLGQTRQQTEATIRLRRSEQELTIARRRLYDPEIIGNSRAYRQAQEEVVTAENNVAEALQKVQSFTGGVAAARTLAAVTVAGAAFGIGLRAVDFGLEAVSIGLQNFIDIGTGFSTTSARITGQLAVQSRALHGNAEAALANAEATAGISAAASASIDPQLRLVTQVKAGALAMAEASDLFRASIGAGRAPTGLVGGFGGILGGPAFAQQLGGGRGFSELIAEDINAALNPVRAQQEGLRFGIPGLPGPLGAGGGLQFRPQTAEEAAAGVEAVGVQLQSLNDAARRAAVLTGDLARVEFSRTDNLDDIARATAAAAAAGNTYFEGLAKNHGIIVRLNGEVTKSGADLNKALTLAATGQGIPDTAQLRRAAIAQQQREFEIQREVQVGLIRRQQQRELPSILAAAERQQQFTLQTQLPAEAALQHLAAPAPPIGTGIVAANAEEQARIVEGQQRSIELQEDLNAQYEAGRQVLIETYKVPPTLLNQVTSIGREIASISAGIANQQAAYQVAQYNFQLHIARRTLSDIGGLTGRNFGEGQSYLGVLERQNLALSRQAQLLNFALAQRQINFQQAVAGFSTPGITPEERQANVKQAQIEADFAQKQLDIQRQMFGNQVQIVDIQNLRQGADLAAQIGLLLQGRQVTIDTALAQEQLTRLQSQQAILVGQVGTYLTKVNNLTSVAYGQIQQLEAAAGRAMYGTAFAVLDSFGVVLSGLRSQLNNLTTYGAGAGGGQPPLLLASGGMGLTSGATPIIAGEAGSEHVTVLRNPRPVSGLEGLGGVTNNTVNFGDVYVRDEADINRLAAAVMNAMGVRSSLVGLRLTG